MLSRSKRYSKCVEIIRRVLKRLLKLISQQQLMVAARMSTCSRSQQQLRGAALHLPALDLYLRHSVQLLHPRVTALQEEYRPVDNASSPSKLDNNASLSSLLPVVPTWTCRKCVQPSTGVSCQSRIKMVPIKKLANLIYMVKFQKVLMVLLEESVYRCDKIDFEKKRQHSFI